MMGTGSQKVAGFAFRVLVIVGLSAPAVAQPSAAPWVGVSRSDGDPLRPSLSIMDKILKRKDVTGNLKDMACGCQLDPKRGRVSQPFECAPVVDAGTDGAADLRAVRIISEEELAAPLPCFKEGISACRREKGFRKALSDPHLAVVVPAPVAAALNGFRHGPVEAPATPVQGCAVTVDNTRGTFELGKQWDGYVARAMLYAAKHYNVRTRLLPGELQQISNQHPPTPQERLMSMEGAAFGVPQALIDEFATQ